MLFVLGNPPFTLPNKFLHKIFCVIIPKNRLSVYPCYLVIYTNYIIFYNNTYDGQIVSRYLLGLDMCRSGFSDAGWIYMPGVQTDTIKEQHKRCNKEFSIVTVYQVPFCSGWIWSGY